MRMPGFSAEATLYKTSQPYRELKAAATSADRVVAAMRCCETCDLLCELHPNSQSCRLCYMHCIDCRF
jgi:hypothetical protein